MVKPQQGDSVQISASKRPVYRVASAGLDPRDVRLIEIVFRHSQYNRYDFQVLEGLDLTRTDILIANPGDPAGLDALIAVRSFPRPIPSVNAVPRGAQAAARYSITIDRLTLQLLPILNRVVELEELVPAAPGDDEAGEAEEVEADGLALAVAAPVIASSASEAAASAIAQAAGRAAGLQVVGRALASLPGQDPLQDRAWMELVTRAPAPARLRALVADPSAAARQQVSRALGRMGLEVHGVVGVAAALQDLAERHADLVVVESCLVDGDGFELIRRMRALAAYRFTPVLLLRSRPQILDTARARLAKEVTLLTKPVTRAALESIVRQSLRDNAVVDDLEELLSPG
jgi:CheY-like chemotaxis protein